MGNIDIETIRKKGFKADSKLALVEKYCRECASEYTDEFIDRYNNLEGSHNGRYINSDLMKMVYPFYAKNNENRKLYNLAITNSAAVLTNEAYRRAILRNDINRCIFIVGPYGAGKTYFSQSLFENNINENLLKDSIIYEGSITPPAFEEKIEYAIKHGVVPDIIALNPSLELSIRNIQERANRIGRDVEKNEVVDKFSSVYEHLSKILQKFNNIAYTIYNKNSNIPFDLNAGSKNIEDLNHGTKEWISDEYDRIKALLKKENRTSGEIEL